VIDLHSHILPGLDDGARDLEEAVAIARAAVQDGTRIIAATPHVREDYPTTSSAMANGVEHLRRALADAGVDLVVLPGGELSLEQLDRLGTDDLHRFGLGGNPNYLLLETPYVGWPLAFGEIVADLTGAGITPVIGHPERNDEVQQNPDLLAELVRGGALVQLTAASVEGRLGKAARATAQRLLERELVHLIGSDAHSPEVREVGLSGACAAIGDQALARWLTEDVPQAILQNEELPSRPPTRRSLARRGLLARLLGR
jgi:protein-tyrosine phosphatase